jgi:hypothetical protein
MRLAQFFERFEFRISDDNVQLFGHHAPSVSDILILTIGRHVNHMEIEMFRVVVFGGFLMLLLVLSIMVWLGLETDRIIAANCQKLGKLPIYTRTGVVCAIR